MGNKESKSRHASIPSQITTRDNGNAEAEDVRSRSCLVYYPNGEENYRNVYAFETAKEFLDSCLGHGGHEDCAVVLYLSLRGEIMIPHNTEFGEYMDEVEYIKIVKQGIECIPSSATDDLNKSIKLKK